MHTCTHTCTYVQTHAYTGTYTYTHKNIHIHTQEHTHAHTHMQTHMYTHWTLTHTEPLCAEVHRQSGIMVESKLNGESQIEPESVKDQTGICDNFTNAIKLEN